MYLPISELLTPPLLSVSFSWKFPWYNGEPGEQKQSLPTSAPGTDPWSDKLEMTVTRCGCGHNPTCSLARALVWVWLPKDWKTQGSGLKGKGHRVWSQ